jgi:hypothetical protein
MQTATIYNHETVTLDGESFEHFRDCRFDDCEWKFDDAAARTLAHLKLVWASGGKAPVQALIKEITGSGGR